MTWKALAALKSFARSWLLRSRMEHDMDREMRFHLEARAADLQAHGIPRAEAERRARADFGDMVLWKEAGREVRGLRPVDDLAADLRYAARTMRRAPGFTVAAVVSLALGIGAATAIFGLFDLLLLKPIPASNPHELVHITTAGERGEANSGSSNYPWFSEVASRTDLFSDAMLVRHDVYKVGIAGRVEPITGQRVTTNYYSLLGVRAALGRTFAPTDRPEAGAEPVAVISHGLWQRRFGGDPNVLGQSITVDQRAYTIVGVTPAEFHGILVGWTMDVTMPLDTAEFADRGNWFTMPLIARLKPDVDVTRVAAQLDPLLVRLVDARVTERFRHRYLERVVVGSAAQGITDLRENFSRPLRLLMIAVGLLLLIACVNLAGLLVARNASRQHELGMRLALGASRGRIVRQLLTESGVLAVMGATLGLLVAIDGSNLLLGLMPPYFGPVSATVAPDARVLAFGALAAVVTTLLFGLMPAWQGASLGLLPALNRTNQRTTTARARVGRTLVVAQFALSLVLVAGAALFLRTLLNLAQVETGFDRGHVLVARIDPQGTAYERERLREFQREMLAALAKLPGVQHASLATGTPFNGDMNGRRLRVPGFEPRDADDSVIQVNLVGPGYFDALQIPILRGRAIDSRDQPETGRVAVVSDAFARRYFGDADGAVGRTFLTYRGSTAISHEIVGVARDVRYQDLRTPSERLVYQPWFQADDVRLSPFEFLVRTEGNPANTINMVRSEMQRLRPDAPILAIETLNSLIKGRLLSERLLAMLGTFFAIVALTLASVGVYGLLAHLVARRVPEIGVRLALGARPDQMLWMMLRENLVLASIGSIIGIACAAVSLRVLDGVLFGLSPTDGVNLVSAALILVLVSLAAALVPARRAASVDPLVALRVD
jgi:predicted permease